VTAHGVSETRFLACKRGEEQWKLISVEGGIKLKKKKNSMV
jgi:hypothetical protein